MHLRHYTKIRSSTFYSVKDPYPRKESAGGYAFIDTKVDSLFSTSGLSKEVNRATSLRNFVKMALVASDRLKAEDTSQVAISKLDKTDMIDSIDELRFNFEKNGVLLLNTALIFTDKKSTKKHVKAWKPFVQTLLHALEEGYSKTHQVWYTCKRSKKTIFTGYI